MAKWKYMVRMDIKKHVRMVAAHAEGLDRQAGGEVVSFDEADYYDCFDGAESFSSESVKEAIGEYIDLNYGKACESVLDKILRLSPIKVYAFKKEDVTPEWTNALALRLAEEASESWADEYGDPEGDQFDPRAIDYLKHEFRDALSRVVQQHRVWHCRDCGTREYSTEEVERLMREHKPEWFKEIL